MEEIILSPKQYNSIQEHLRKIKNDIITIKQKTPGEAYLIDNLELVNMLKVNYRTIQRWRADGRLPYIKLGRRYYYRTDLFPRLFRVLPNEPQEVEHPPPEDDDPVDPNSAMPCHNCPLFRILLD